MDLCLFTRRTGNTSWHGTMLDPQRVSWWQPSPCRFIPFVIVTLWGTFPLNTCQLDWTGWIMVYYGYVGTSLLLPPKFKMAFYLKGFTVGCMKRLLPWMVIMLWAAMCGSLVHSVGIFVHLAALKPEKKHTKKQIVVTTLYVLFEKRRSLGWTGHRKNSKIFRSTVE